MKNITFIYCCILFLCQCQTPEISETQQKELFDLAQFIQEKGDSLRLHQVNLEKTVQLNGSSETKTISAPNWTAELSEFSSSNINRPAWVDEYEVQKIKDGFSYSLKKDKDLDIKQIIVTETNGQTLVRISKSIKNILNKSQKEMSFHSEHGYSIRQIRASLGMNPDTLLIQGKFKN